jgi:inosose dehydratase
MERRNLLKTIPILAATPHFRALAQKETKQIISCNAYNWLTFYKRENKQWGATWPACIAEVAKTGISAFEPSLENTTMAKEIGMALKMHNIKMPSVYVNSVLHEKDQAETSINNIIEIASIAKQLGTKIIVTNPTPLKWGVNTNLKTDQQLQTQAASLNKLGKKLKEMNLTLAYHTHDMEMMAGAREFHHIMQNTEEQFMSFCFDLHWVFRGSANSALAVYDVLKIYGHRIVELHIRQSIAGVWSETFSANGDIDYNKVVRLLKQRNIKPLLVIEQCIEAQSPNTLDAVAAHITNLKEVRKVFNL